jgi:hypothetical protein
MLLSSLACRDVAEYFPIDLTFPRALPMTTTDEFGAYARRIYASLGPGSSTQKFGSRNRSAARRIET